MPEWPVWHRKKEGGELYRSAREMGVVSISPLLEGVFVVVGVAAVVMVDGGLDSVARRKPVLKKLFARGAPRDEILSGDLENI